MSETQTRVREKKRDSKFSFYESYRKAARQIPDSNMRLAWYELVADYGLDGKEPGEETPWELRAMFEVAQNNIANASSHVEAGRLGGQNGAGVSRGWGNQNARKNESKTKAKQKQTKANESGIGLGKGSERIPLPKQHKEWNAEEAAYCAEHGCCNIENGKCRCGQRPPRILDTNAEGCPCFKKAAGEKEVA